MLEYTWAKAHAALNDLPAALFLAAVLFELAGWALRRETLRAVGFWSLWAGVVGGWMAYVAGRMAEDSIDLIVGRTPSTRAGTDGPAAELQTPVEPH